MFVYEEIDDNWLQRIKEYNFKKPMNDGLPTETCWYIDHDKNEALYYIGWVSSAILRCDGEDMYEFAYIYNDKCIPVTANIFPETGNSRWNNRNSLILNYNIVPELDPMILRQKIVDAIIFYLDNIYIDRKK